MQTKPARFIIYYNGVPCRLHPDMYLNGRKRYQYSSEKLAQKYLNELIDSIKWATKHRYSGAVSVKELKSIDFSKFEIVEFGEIRRIKPLGDSNAT